MNSEVAPPIQFLPGKYYFAIENELIDQPFGSVFEAVDSLLKLDLVSKRPESVALKYCKTNLQLVDTPICIKGLFEQLGKTPSTPTAAVA